MNYPNKWDKRDLLEPSAMSHYDKFQNHDLDIVLGGCLLVVETIRGPPARHVASRLHPRVPGNTTSTSKQNLLVVGRRWAQWADWAA